MLTKRGVYTETSAKGRGPENPECGRALWLLIHIRTRLKNETLKWEHKPVAAL